jgi:preprotein translocase subunit SecA
MQTGEGKTLVATCPAVYEAVMGNKVHVISCNEYLSARDFRKMGPLYAFLGLSTGLVVSNMQPDDKKMSYDCDIIYATNNELGFDYLRDNMKTEGPFVQGNLDFAIIDEVDSVLIDEARTPLIISGQAEDNSKAYYKMASIVRHFKEGEDEDYTRDEENKKLLIATDKAIKKVEQAFGIENLYSGEASNVFLLNVLNQMLKAFFIFSRDKDYIVKDGSMYFSK